MKIKSIISILLLVFLLVGCNKKGIVKKTSNSKTLFTEVANKHTTIDFNNNNIQQNLEFNYVEYPYIYIGGGVAVGDVNNDGLQDVYFTSNKQSNKLYINKEDFKFKDITEKAQVQDNTGWTTGVTMIDINNDGWLDIYVCKSASLKDNELRRNKLFINQKNGTFKEDAKKWGLDHDGFSIQSYFFDYDKDGDLDMYLVNHRPDFQNANEIILDKKFFPETSDHLFRNDGDKFTDVTIKAKIANKEFGLSASIGDFNNDGWLDIYVANDFIGPDYLYINQKNGTFKNEINTRLKHISYSSMGSDYADINNDLLPDLIVLDMSAEDHKRSKENMGTMNTKGFQLMLEANYHYSYMSNTLHLNNGNGSFSDIGQLAGVSKTDWSWAPLIADFDNDGFKDIFISNGIERNMTNQDYLHDLDEKLANTNTIDLHEMISMMPADKLSNYIYKNNGDLTFKNNTQKWGLNRKINTNGVAYADFDNDGDLDLVMNNMKDKASIYKNNSTGNFISIKLIGGEKNINAIGARVKVYTNEKEQYQELYLSRGYQSSVSNILNFGLGDEEIINRIEVIWGDDSVLAAENVEANQTLTFNKKDFKFDGEIKKTIPRNFSRINPNSLRISFEHNENKFNDFSKQILMPQKQSQQGPTFSVADINNDGLEDFFVGGALNQPAEMYFQTNGKFEKINQQLFEKDKTFEDNGSHFFDADNDGDLDLYVASGGYELDENSPLLQDRLYINDGKGNFTKSSSLPKMITNTKSVKSIDFDNDGDNDLVIGGHVIPGKYPIAPPSYVLQNNNGRFKNVTQDIAPEFSEIGVINDLIFSDYDNDGDKDLIVVGEWMPITIFKNTDGKFYLTEIPSFKNTEGWWNTVKEVDLDNDGDLDYLIGNVGDNNKFHPSVKKPLHVYGNYFDDNDSYDMVLSKIYKGNLVPTRGKECSTDQNPFVSEKMATYQDFASSTLADIYGEQELESSLHKEVYQFSSVYALNNGDGTFSIYELPTSAQIGPTMAFEIMDVNNDGIQDVVGIGAIHETEVETIRYDANIGYILLGDTDGSLEPYKDISFYNSANAKAMKKITINNVPHLFIANNNETFTIFRKK